MVGGIWRNCGNLACQGGAVSASSGCEHRGQPRADTRQMSRHMAEVIKKAIQGPDERRVAFKRWRNWWRKAL